MRFSRKPTTTFPFTKRGRKGKGGVQLFDLLGQGLFMASLSEVKVIAVYSTWWSSKNAFKFLQAEQEDRAKSFTSVFSTATSSLAHIK